jgi:hypothetical protein
MYQKLVNNYENVIVGNEQDFLFKIDELGIKPSFNLRDNFDKIFVCRRTR